MFRRLRLPRTAVTEGFRGELDQSVKPNAELTFSSSEFGHESELHRPKSKTGHRVHERVPSFRVVNTYLVRPLKVTPDACWA